MYQALPCIVSPFGMVMSDRAWTSAGGGYRFGFNGMENGNESSTFGHHYTTFYREYDSRSSKWWSVDPMCKLSPWESPYMSMGANPITNIDPEGDRWFDRATRQRAREMRRAYRGVKRSRTATSADKSQAIQGLKELKELKKDNQLVRISVETTAPGGAFTTMAVIGGQNVLQIVVPSVAAGTPNAPNGYLLRTMAHEMKHAYDFIDGKISFQNGPTFSTVINGTVFQTRPAGLLYDVEDEVAAFKRGQVFDKTFWGFARPNQIIDRRLVAGSAAYSRRPVIQLTTRTQMAALNRAHVNAGAAAIPLTTVQAKMSYRTYQNSLPAATREIFR